MKFSASQSALLSALSTVAGVVPAKSPMPVLTHILAKLDKNELTLSATDLEVSMETKLEVKGERDGTALLPARKLLDLVRGWGGDGLMNVETKDSDRLNVRDAGGKLYQLATENVANYPKIPTLEALPVFKFDRMRLKRMIEKAIFAVSQDELRPQLTGVYVQAVAGELRLVSTDGHRLVKVSALNTTYAGDEKTAIVPKKAMQSVQRVCEREGEVEVVFAGNQIGFRVGHTTLISKLIEGRYPNYEAVIPQGNNNTLTVGADELGGAVRRAAIVSNEISRQIRLKLDSEKIQIHVEDAEQGNEGEESVPCSYDGDPMEVGYNAAYVMDMLKQIPTGEVVMKLGGPTSAGIVTPAEQEKDENLLMLIMPVRLN
ncbi:DNA polymerase III subunit beta [candidate division KSB1 bacterium]|nr:DNA polymerase III subunit beta [candidate division KSB1 bacterium]